MKIDYTIGYTIAALCTLFWIFPAIRQYKTDLFWYFLVLAVEDPLAILFKWIKLFEIYDSYLVWAFILIIVLFWSSRKKISMKIMVLIFFLILGITIGASRNVQYGTLALFHLAILFFFLKRSIRFIAENGKANLFHLSLLLYETTIILKMLAQLTDAQTGTAFFHITTIFEMMIAIFFSIFKEDDKRLFINLKNV